MDSGRGYFRRRGTQSRWSAARPAPRAHEGIHTYSLLEQWRCTLAKVEQEAARHRCPEVEMLAGAAALAVDELIKATLAVELQPDMQ